MGESRPAARDALVPLAIANASAAEVESQVIIAGDIHCLDQPTSDRIAEQRRYVGRMINRLTARLDAG